MVLICGRQGGNVWVVSLTLLRRPIIFFVLITKGNIWFDSINKFPLQLNPDVNAFQRKFVNEVRRCEEMERKLSKWNILIDKLRASVQS